MLPQLKNQTLEVSQVTGGQIFHAVDQVLPGRGLSLVFERYFNSLKTLSFQNGWMFSFDEYLVEEGDNLDVRHVMPSGSERIFTRNGNGTYTPYGSSNYETLSKNATTGIFTVTFKDQTTRQFLSNGRLYRVLDRDGNFLEYTWTAGTLTTSKIQKITDASGRVVTMTEFVAGPNETQWIFTDWAGRQWKYSFNSGNVHNAYTDPEGSKWQYLSWLDGVTVSGFQGIRQVVLPSGDTWVTVHEVGVSPQTTKVARMVYWNGLEVKYTWDWTNRKTTVDVGGRITQLEYDSNFNITKKTDALGSVWQFQYDGSGNMTQATDPRLGVKVFTYDSKGNRLTERDQLNNTRTFTYHATFNSVTQITEPTPFSYTTVFSYDSGNGRLLSVTDRLGKVTSYEYFSNGLLKKVTDPNLNTVQYTYTDHGQLATVTDGRGKVTSMSHDLFGNLISVKDPLNRVSTRKYNKNNELVEVTDPLGNTTRFYQDVNGNQTEVHDALGRVTQTTFDAMGLVTEVRNALGHTVGFVYDRFQNLVELVNMNDQSWLFGYDSLDRMTRSTDPLGRDTTWAHDPYCNTVTKTDANGWKTKTYKDILCRVSKVEYHDDSYVAFTYDNLSRRTTMTQPGKRYGEVKFGSPHYGTETADNIVYNFDANDRMTSVIYPSPWGAKTIAMGYDDGGRMTSLTDVNGVATAYTYFGNNVVNTATRASKTVTYALDDASQVASVTLPNGVIGAMAYDSVGQVTRMQYTKDGANLLMLNYEMDKVGNRTRKAVARGAGVKYGTPKYGQTGYATGAPTVHDYSYDATNQLVAGSQDGQFVFDGQGNRTAKITYGGTEHSTFDAADELLSQGDVAFEWTSLGDLAAKREGTNRTSYRFNYGGHLEQVTLPGGAAVRYSYLEPSALLRDRTTPGGQPTRFFWTLAGMGSILNELDASGSTAASYFLIGDFITGQIAGTDNRWFLTDALGSVLALTDDSGAVTSTYDVDAWGNALSSSIDNVPGGMPYQFLGAFGVRFDSVTDEHYIRRRWYDGKCSRFVSVDPIGLSAGFNVYGYANANPVLEVDLMGLVSEKPIEIEPPPPPEFKGSQKQRARARSWWAREMGCHALEVSCVYWCQWESGLCPQIEIDKCVAGCLALAEICRRTGRWPKSVDPRIVPEQPYMPPDID